MRILLTSSLLMLCLTTSETNVTFASANTGADKGKKSENNLASEAKGIKEDQEHLHKASYTKTKKIPLTPQAFEALKTRKVQELESLITSTTTKLNDKKDTAESFKEEATLKLDTAKKGLEVIRNYKNPTSSFVWKTFQHLKTEVDTVADSLSLDTYRDKTQKRNMSLKEEVLKLEFTTPEELDAKAFIMLLLDQSESYIEFSKKNTTHLNGFTMAERAEAISRFAKSSLKKAKKRKHTNTNSHSQPQSSSPKTS